MRTFISLLFLLITVNAFAQEKLKKKNGEMAIKNTNGIIVEKGNVKNHLRTGLWTKYYDTGERKEEVTYENGFLNGPCRIYSKNGPLSNKGKKLTASDTAFAEQLKRYQPAAVHTRASSEYAQDGAEEIVSVVDQVQEVEEKPQEVFTFTEKMPAFPGDYSAFLEYLKKNLQYPEAEKEAGKQGTVYVSFTVQLDGSITGVKVVKSVAGAPGFDKEAIRLISTMPDWIPGEMNGRPVAVTMTQPVRFVLQ